MRVLIAIVVLCIGCNEHGKRPAFDAVPADAVTPSCNPSGTCTTGPACGLTCCGTGEHCVQDVCMCADHPACTNGDTCMNAGPGAHPGAGPAATCGILCCGGPTPCPI